MIYLEWQTDRDESEVIALQQDGNTLTIEQYTNIVFKSQLPLASTNFHNTEDQRSLFKHKRSQAYDQP